MCVQRFVKMVPCVYELRDLGVRLTPTGLVSGALTHRLSRDPVTHTPGRCSSGVREFRRRFRC